MNYLIVDKSRKSEIVSLFTAVFSAAEGDQEGAIVGGLVSSLAAHIDNKEIICISADDDGETTAAIFLTRLRFDESVDVFMLAPVAVSTAYQGRGIGQTLIQFGLSELKNRSAGVAITYGDPAFYSKAGFQPLSEAVIQAPLPLSMPEGWLGQSLINKTLPILKSRPSCVQAFDNPDYW